MQLSIRPASPSDKPFVEFVFFETQRWIIERLFGWRGDAVERRKFEESYSERATKIVSLEGTDVGWFSVTRATDGIEINSIYLLPNAQNKGIGTILISEVIEEARSAALPLKLSAAKINPARNLYERLGFRVSSESEFKVFMELR